jgi:hypothetical protein
VNILVFVLVPMLVATAYALATWVRNRQPTSVESGVDAFRREMTALSPDAAPVQRRPERPSSGPGAGRPAPRRPQAGPAEGRDPRAGGPDRPPGAGR